MSASIYIDLSKCTGEMSCMRACPTSAIRVKSAKAKIIQEKCIDCGECIKACKSNAINSMTSTYQDLSNYKYTVAIPSLALYSQFDRQYKPKNIISALRKIGFDEVIDVTGSCVKILHAISNYTQNNINKPAISSFCPSILKLINMNYPVLKNNVIPLMSAMELCALEAKTTLSEKLKLRKESIGIVYITPCASKMTMINKDENEYYSNFDAAISIKDIYSLLYNKLINENPDAEQTEYYNVDGYGLNMGKADGITNLFKNKNCIDVSGVNNATDVLDDIAAGKLADIDLVDMNFCYEGCINGPLTVENMYKARNKMTLLINEFGESKLPLSRKSEKTDEKVFVKDLFSSFKEDEMTRDIKKEIIKINERNELMAKLPNIDCGACGAPKCSDFADDIVKGEAEIKECWKIAIDSFSGN